VYISTLIADEDNCLLPSFPTESSWLCSANISLAALAARVAAPDAGYWGRYKFAPDVGGRINAWSNLFVRRLLGCCVLKVRSQRGFRQWYYNNLVPWRHYVPVRDDMADLVEKIEWCRSHDGECAEIARAGSAFAHAMSVDGEIAEAASRLEAACGRPQDGQPVALASPDI
jgi:hypothetical protein